MSRGLFVNNYGMRCISSTATKQYTAFVRVVVLNARLFKLLNNWWTSSKNRKRALATGLNGRHVVDEVHLRLLVLDNLSSTAGRSTYFETSY
ncbi:hypothetical protein T06_5065 [Trichinella sp. T6]|nr:hypothetical protein T06_5065 [Trichinella sp. T6]